MANISSMMLPIQQTHTDKPFFALPAAPVGWAYLVHRGLLQLTGPDSLSFLQGLISQDVKDLPTATLRYGALLTPQGKWLFDLFIWRDENNVWLESERERLSELAVLLNRYRLRAKVEISLAPDWQVWAVAASPDVRVGQCFQDPRHPQLGWRAYSQQPLEPTLPLPTHDMWRYHFGAPDGSRDLVVGKDILLEANIDALHGVSFSKGCYMGQELTARTHYRALLKKRLQPVALDTTAALPFGSIIYNDAQQEVGELRGQTGPHALAMMRLQAQDQAPWWCQSTAGQKILVRPRPWLGLAPPA